jgi:G6PDH family F420-dependent oxidoreductase
VVAVQPDPQILKRFRAAGGEGKRTHGQVALSYDRDEAKAREYAMRFRFGVTGWKVMAELPNPVNFEAAARTVRPEDVLQSTPAGPDPEPHAQAVRGYVEAGFEEISVVQVGDDHEGFFEFWANDVRPQLP